MSKVIGYKKLPRNAFVGRSAFFPLAILNLNLFIYTNLDRSTNDIGNTANITGVFGY